MNLTELEALAKLAGSRKTWLSNGYAVRVDNRGGREYWIGTCPLGVADYIAAANPDTILKLCELVREMAEALDWLRMHGSNRYLTREAVQALTKYKEWTG
jgi:hypothetical protein